MPIKPDLILRPGSPLRESAGLGRGRLGGFVSDASGTMFGLTTSLIFRGNARTVTAGSDLELTALDERIDAAGPLPIADCVCRLQLGGGFTPQPITHPADEHEAVTKAFAALGARVTVIRDPRLPSYGQVVGVNCPVPLIDRQTGDQRIYLGALAIKPDLDGAFFANHGDAGALLLSTEGQIIGMLIGRAEGLYYAAPLDAFLERHSLTYAGPIELLHAPKAAAMRAQPAKRLAEITQRYRDVTAVVSNADAEGIGARIGEDIANEQQKLRTAAAKENGLRAIWPAFAVTPSDDIPRKGDRLARNQRLCRAQILRAWRGKTADPLPMGLDDKFAHVRARLGLDGGDWGDAFRLIGEIERSFAAMREEHIWRDSHDRLTIPHSGYHEELALADVIASLSFARGGQPIFEMARSPWVFGRQLSDHRTKLNEDQGGGDIRLVNVIARDPKPSELLVQNRPILQHYGYTAYARRGWLRNVLDLPSAPRSAKAWIAAALRGCAPMGEATLPARAWLLARGKPLNYSDTEFPPIFNYVWDLARKVGKPGALPAFSEKTPDDAFHEFLVRPGRVFMSGSIYDLLIDEWFSNGDDIVTLLEADDFHDLRLASGGRLGKNALLFSPRLKAHPDLASLIVDLYQNVWQTLLSRLDRPDSGEDTLAYLASLLAPNRIGRAGWSFAASGDAIARLMTIEVKPAPDEVEEPADDAATGPIDELARLRAKKVR